VGHTHTCSTLSKTANHDAADSLPTVSLCGAWRAGGDGSGSGSPDGTCRVPTTPRAKHWCGNNQRSCVMAMGKNCLHVVPINLVPPLSSRRGQTSSRAIFCRSVPNPLRNDSQLFASLSVWGACSLVCGRRWSSPMMVLCKRVALENASAETAR
jgi:hypothetical protein